MRLSEYLFTLGDFFTVVRKMVLHIPVRTIIGELFLVMVTALLVFIVGISLESLAFIIFLLYLIYWRRDGLLAIRMAMVGLGLLILLQLLTILAPGIPYAWSQHLGLWVFYSWAIGIIKQAMDAIWQRR